MLTLNSFSFPDRYYKQINGVAMGTKLGPSYANLFVGHFEHQFFNQYNGPKPELYRRYIDDCVGATSSTREELNQFTTAANSFYPALKYTYFFDISRYQSFRRRQRFMHQCALRTHRLSWFFVVFIFTSITSRIPFLILGFLDSDPFVLRSLIFP